MPACSVVPNPDSGWSLSDLVAAWTAVSYAGFAIWLRPANRTAERISALLATGFSLGPLLMILADPFLQQLGVPLHLAQRVVTEARTILWWASAFAVVSLTRELF